jgi:hypothetical protein
MLRLTLRPAMAPAFVMGDYFAVQTIALRGESRGLRGVSGVSRKYKGGYTTLTHYKYIVPRQRKSRKHDGTMTL